MHDDSRSVLQRLADGQEALGIDARFFPLSLRRALEEGAAALAYVEHMRVILWAPMGGLAASAQPERPPAAPSPVAQTPVPPVSPTAPVPGPVPPSPATAAAPIASAATDGEGRASAVGPLAPLPPGGDLPDASGWRPSEDAMLLDEYEGLGLPVREVALRHGRSEGDVIARLRTQHGLTVPAEPSPPAATPPQAADLAPPDVPAATATHSTPGALPAAPAPPVAVAAEPAFPGFEAVIADEMTHAGPGAVHFATGVLKHLERVPSATLQLQDYLQTPKARAKLTDRLRLALLAKVVAHGRTT